MSKYGNCEYCGKAKVKIASKTVDCKTCGQNTHCPSCRNELKDDELDMYRFQRYCYFCSWNIRRIQCPEK